MLLLGEVRAEGVDVGAGEEDGEVEAASGSGLRMKTMTMSVHDIARGTLLNKLHRTTTTRTSRIHTPRYLPAPSPAAA